MAFNPCASQSQSSKMNKTFENHLLSSKAPSGMDYMAHYLIVIGNRTSQIKTR